MSKNALNQSTPLWRRLDATLFALLVALISGRCMIDESLPFWSPMRPINYAHIASGETPTMMLWVGVILTTGVAWLLPRLWRGQWTWQTTGALYSIALLILATIISGLQAGNRHHAVVLGGGFLSVFLLIPLLVQLLDRPERRRILLCAIVATGVLTAYRCFEKLHYELPSVQEQFQANADAVLLQQGITPGTFAAEQYLERLRSGDIGGFFSISNTAASFFILALAATGALFALSLSAADKTKRLPFGILAGLTVLAQLYGLFIIASKGGWGALLFAVFLFFFWLLTRKLIAARPKVFFFMTVLLIAGFVAAIVSYGKAHDRLPSASMWVRWHYWSATGDMIADHGWLGVGPGSFKDYYERYMNPAAPEVVQDPHCMWLSIWSQWGVLGFGAILFFIGRTAWRGLNRQHAELFRSAEAESPSTKLAQKTRYLSWVLGLTIGTVFVRAMASRWGEGFTENEIMSVVLISFIVPALLWLITFAILLGITRPDTKDSTTNAATETGKRLAWVFLGCGLLGLLVHNSIDFAIFHPGVGTLAASLTAVFLSGLSKPTEVSLSKKKPRLCMRVAAGAILGMILTYWLFVYVPIKRSYESMQEAIDAATRHEFFLASQTAAEAAEINPLDPLCFELAGEYARQNWLSQGRSNTTWLEQTIDYWRQAHQRNPQDGAIVYRLAQLTDAASIILPAQQSKYRLATEKWYEKARQHKPGNTNLLADVGMFYERQGNNDLARKFLQRALNIEAEFQSLYRRLYPNRATPARLDLPRKEKAQQILHKLGPDTAAP